MSTIFAPGLIRKDAGYCTHCVKHILRIEYMQHALRRACRTRRTGHAQDAPHWACNTCRVGPSTRRARHCNTHRSSAPHTRLVCSAPLKPLAIFRARLFASLVATRLVMFLKFEPLDAFFTT